MNTNTMADVKSLTSEEVHKLFGGVPRKSVVDEAVGKVIDNMVEQGRAHLMSDEEERLLKSFRRFKLTCKPGSVFKWQTHPEAGVVIATETSLISDPQEVR